MKNYRSVDTCMNCKFCIYDNYYCGNFCNYDNTLKDVYRSKKEKEWYKKNAIDVIDENGICDNFEKG